MKIERLEVTDVAQIYRFWNEYADIINTGNIEQWSALWSNDSIWLPPEALRQIGKEQIQKLAQSQSDQYHPKLSINPEVVRILGDQAYTYGSFTTILTFMEGEDKTRTQRTGKFLSILGKQTNGAWKILVDCFNYNEAAERSGSGFGSELRKRGEILNR